MTPRDAIAAVLIVAGALFMLLAAVGLVRLPDVFLRLSAASKAATLGVACVLFAVAEDFADVGVTSRALAAILFLLLTVPVASHLLGRAAYYREDALWSGTVLDEMAGRADIDRASRRSSAHLTAEHEPPAEPETGA